MSRRLPRPTGASAGVWDWASGSGVPLGVGLSAPLYRPYYYAPPYPVYVAPPPVVVQPAPAPVIVQPAPAPQPACRPTYYARLRGPGLHSGTANCPGGHPCPLGQLPAGDAGKPESTNERGPETRAAACLALGRLRRPSSVGPLTHLLQQDGDPAVRDSAARGLGLIADPAALTALEQAAQSDGDRDVRHSAAFAVEVIRAHHPHP